MDGIYCVEPSNGLVPQIELQPNNPYSLINYLAKDRQKIWIKEIIKHPNFEHKTGTRPQNDISIVKLKTPLTFTNNIKQACLPEPNFTPQTKAVVSGWGRSDEGMYISEYRTCAIISRGLFFLPHFSLRLIL